MRKYPHKVQFGHFRTVSAAANLIAVRRHSQLAKRTADAVLEMRIE
jgi:hypothetical protein